MQYRVFGVPKESELKSSENVVYVEAYIRSDGTEVKADGQYYGISTRLADGDELTRDMKESNDFRKIGDIKDEKLQNEYIKKAAEMYKLDPNDPNLKEKAKDTNIIIPKSGSKLNRQVKSSPAFQEWVAKNYDDIKSGKLENEKSSLEFPFGIVGDKRGLFGTIHNTDLINSKVNPDGSLTTTYSDGYDFDKMEKNEKDSGYKKTVVNVNNNAYEQQEKEKLQRSLLSSSVRLTKEEIEEILRKYYRK